jgi:aquaporin NIP
VLTALVTVAFTLTRHFPKRDAIAYVLAQIAGAVLGALVLLAVWTDKPATLGTTFRTVGAGSALLYEGVLTAVLMFVIMAVATDTRAVGAGRRSPSAPRSPSTRSSAARSPARA